MQPNLQFDTDATQLQLSGTEHNGLFLLAGFVKRTYDIIDTGKCILSDIQEPLHVAPVYDDKNKNLLLHDIDCFMHKAATDVVVKGLAQSGRVQSQLTAVIHVSSQNKPQKFLVTGKRAVKRHQDGRIEFSKPSDFEKIPLDYSEAYGGIDHVAERNFEMPSKEIRDAMPDHDWYASSPYRYGRNTAGKGFVTNPSEELFETLELPSIEEPTQLLTPANLVLQDPTRWAFQPVAKSPGWMNHEWFPRILHFGMMPEAHTATFKESIPEYYLETLAPSIFKMSPDEIHLLNRAANGAWPGLQLQWMIGNESIRLINIFPGKPDFTIQLPAERPSISVDGRRGKMLATKPELHNVVVDAENKKLSMVWKGSAPALRPYLVEELIKMPFEVKW
ncbi:MAG: DUF2169 domain-containing protein [Bacteroidetes bacterium]|nr:DUF2169 domain-containing protein [Bacteroidota bacterium]